MRLLCALLFAGFAQAQLPMGGVTGVSGGGGDITPVQKAVANAAYFGNPTHCTLSALTPGNALVVAGYSSYNTSNTLSVAATGVTFTSRVLRTDNNTVQVWTAYIPAGVTGTTTVTITPTNGSTRTLGICAEYHSSGGAWTSDPFLTKADAYMGASIGDPPFAWDSGAASATNAGSLLIGVAGTQYGGSVTWAPGTSWTSVNTADDPGANSLYMMERRNVPASSYHATGEFQVGTSTYIECALLILNPPV